MTNKEWLSTLPSEQFYDAFKKAEQEFSCDSNTRLAVIEWLDQEHRMEPLRLPTVHHYGYEYAICPHCGSVLWRG